MRMCMNMLPGVEGRCTWTVAPSEPTLVEAAAWLTRRDGFESCEVLLSVLEDPTLSRGYNGELIAANIILEALDSCCFDARGLRTRFDVHVIDFMKALLPPDPFDKLMDAVLQQSEIGAGTFAETFRNSKLYLTHFIKVLDLGVLKREVLVRYIIRGAGVVCANSKGGVDIVLLFLYEDTRLTATNVSAILVQTHVDDQLAGPLFDSMNPCSLGIFPEKEALPVIRMVCALSAPVGQGEDGIFVVSTSTQPEQRSSEDAHSRICHCPTIDLWCRGISSRTFQCIKLVHGDSYRQLVAQSQCPDTEADYVDTQDYHGPVNIYDLVLRERTLSMYPGATSQDQCWSRFVDVGRGRKDGQPK
ncbi:hypothetical protein OBBRIDRAFT_521038 [Obba rivulosa]|uniref:Uncharacterized protein n=1 Tax=Obba rivulosa TaxID=1052685 RepID=A0A8E2DNU3_9APHY|nr:hypothetical protein OBBRIDRAFT_521038 [Obba rivulosa]